MSDNLYPRPSLNDDEYLERRIQFLESQVSSLWSAYCGSHTCDPNGAALDGSNAPAESRPDLRDAWHDAKARYVDARNLLRGEGYTAPGIAGGVVKSPYHSIMRDALADMVALDAALGD